MSASTLFTDAMALTPAGDGIYDGALDEHWTIGPKVHGGAMLALCANAAQTQIGGELQPIAVSGNFLWAPDPVPCVWSPRCASAAGGSASSTSNSTRAPARLCGRR